jgi:pimeloyl-ACP methyl ester carboxylesterase
MTPEGSVATERSSTIRATAADLPGPVAAVLTADVPDSGERVVTNAAGIPFSALVWGDLDARPLVLIHGVTASAAIWWRIGPALAASGRRVVAVDLPGHGRTGHWMGHYRFRDNATDVAAWLRAAGLDIPAIQIVGHSWGAMTAAALPADGIRPATLVLLEPPAIPLAIIARMADEASTEVPAAMDAARATLAAANPSWSDRDVRAKAEALAQLDVAAARSIVLDNGNWDGGLAELDDPAAAGIPKWIIRGEEASGSLLPDAALPALAARVGADHVLTLAGAPHAPQRTHPEATTLAILRALA